MVRSSERSAAAVAVSILVSLAVLSNATAEEAKSAADPARTLEAFGRLPLITDIALSPDGGQVAQVAHKADSMMLLITDAATHKPLHRSSLPNIKVRGLYWINDHRLVALRSTATTVWGLQNGKKEWMQGFEIDLKANKAIPFLEKFDAGLEHRGVSETMNTVTMPPIVTPGPNGEPRLIVGGIVFPDSHGVLALFHQDGWRSSLFVQGRLETDDWAISPQGELIGRIDYNRETGAWTIFAGPNKGALKAVRTGSDPYGSPVFTGVSQDGETLYVENVETDGNPLYRLRVADRSLDRVDEKLSGGRVFTERSTQIALGYLRSGEDGADYTFFDPKDQKLWTGILKAFKDAKVEFESMSADRSKILIKVFGGDWGYSYLLVDRKTFKADFYADVYDGIGPDQISPQTLTRYKAADGFNIPAYLTLPKGKTPKGLPLIVLPHGGPFARDYMGFDWWSQAYASRGYAVLQPQFRGSDGFGKAHLEAGYGEYGRKMQTDLSDGVAELARQGVVDPRRVAIVGASYGGYAALAGVAFQKDIYRCAVSVAGPTDMYRHQDYIAEKNNWYSRNPATRYWRNYLQVKSDHDSRLGEISPALHADGVSVPVMLIHGKDDTVVPFDQSRKMERALKALNSPVEFVEMKGEDHWLSNSETRLQMLTSSLKFLETCNPVG